MAAPGWGGQEIRVFQECQLLLERRHRVPIVCQPDILHSHSSIDSWLVALAGTLLSVPIIRSQHVQIPIRNHIFNRWLYAKAPSLIIASGRGIVKMVSEHTGIPANKIISIKPAGYGKWNHETFK